MCRLIRQKVFCNKSDEKHLICIKMNKVINKKTKVQKSMKKEPVKGKLVEYREKQGRPICLFFQV